MAGISWVRPTAPAPLRALGLKPDSWDTRPFRSAGSIPLLAAAALIWASKAELAPVPETGAADGEVWAAASAPANDDGVRSRRRPRAAGGSPGAFICATIVCSSSSRVPIVARLMTRACACGR